MRLALLAAPLLLLTCACSATALGNVLSTTRVSTFGRDFSDLGSDSSGVAVSIQPLVGLEPPKRVIVQSTPPAWGDPVPPPPDDTWGLTPHWPVTWSDGGAGGSTKPAIEPYWNEDRVRNVIQWAVGIAAAAVVTTLGYFGIKRVAHKDEPKAEKASPPPAPAP